MLIFSLWVMRTANMSYRKEHVTDISEAFRRIQVPNFLAFSSHGLDYSYRDWFNRLFEPWIRLQELLAINVSHNYRLQGIHKSLQAQANCQLGLDSCAGWAWESVDLWIRSDDH